MSSFHGNFSSKQRPRRTRSQTIAPLALSEWSNETGLDIVQTADEESTGVSFIVKPANRLQRWLKEEVRTIGAGCDAA